MWWHSSNFFCAHRTGLQRLNSRVPSPSCMRTSAMRYQFQITYDVMVFSILAHTSLPMLLAPTSVRLVATINFFHVYSFFFKGPKMYNALASSQEAGSKGTTRLHMDMADALNVMMYSSACEDGSEGYAVWDLFRAEDSDKIRAFLKKRSGYDPPFPPSASASALPQAVGRTNGQAEVVMEGGKGAAGKVAKAPVHARHDPIHGQQFYLDVELRKALWEEYDVKSFRVYQRPGDGVFIPAGCAHQVRRFLLRCGFYSFLTIDFFLRLRMLLIASRSLLTLSARRILIDARSSGRSLGNRIRARCGRRMCSSCAR